jgi:hypothetical protein
MDSVAPTTDPRGALKVAALVYIAAFAPDGGESVNSSSQTSLPVHPCPPVLPPQGGFLFLDQDKFAAAICRSPPATSGHGSQGPRSLPLAKLLEWSILALEMNGEVRAPTAHPPSWVLSVRRRGARVNDRCPRRAVPYRTVERCLPATHDL